MGHKLTPLAVRVGVVEPWRSRWFAKKKEYGKYIVEDFKIRQFVMKNYGFAGISRVDIERTHDQVSVVIFTARPALLIGRRGSQIDKLQSELQKFTQMSVLPPRIVEIEKPELDAWLVADGIREQLLRRAHHRRVMKRAAELTMQAGAKGIKIQLKGRIAGSEMARKEHLIMGKIPLSTIRSNVDHALVEATTKYGQIGIQVWIYKGEYPVVKKEQSDEVNAEENPA
ncbi:MAG: 30S ribosomal protein S3 [Planctomycetota bacterium]|nr:30S ribosomal protein S3 [Planctomycetota bacterium]